MNDETKKYLVILGAVLVQLCLGAIYAWSVFVNPLKAEPFELSTTQTQAIFSVGLATFALVMIFAGKWQDRIGPRKVAMAGGLLLGLGYIFAGMSNGSFPQLALFIGIIGGAGIGLGYVCPIAAGVKWFPDKKGLISGIAVAGFGGGAWIFSQIGSSFISSYGVLKAFLYLGIIFASVAFVGGFLLENPPKQNKNGAKKAESKSTDYAWKEMIGTRKFWLLWIMFTFAAMAGLMVIGILKPFGIFAGLSAAAAGSAVGILAIFNAAGRITWGVVSDKIGRTKSMFMMFLLQGMMMLFLVNMGKSALLLAVAAAWVGFNFGGNFALFPSATADFFGTKNMGINYALVFTSYGVAGIIGPILSGKVFDITGSYLYAFIPAGIVCLIAAGLSWFAKK